MEAFTDDDFAEPAEKAETQHAAPAQLFIVPPSDSILKEIAKTLKEMSARPVDHAPMEDISKKLMAIHDKPADDALLKLILKALETLASKPVPKPPVVNVEPPKVNVTVPPVPKPSKWKFTWNDEKTEIIATAM